MSSGQKLDQFASTNLLTIHINEPTRITDHSATCLDQIISNIPNYVQESYVLPPISNCDHSVIGANLLFRIKRDYSFKRRIWDYGKADFEVFRTSLRRVDWNSCFISEDVDSCCDSWSTLFMEAAEQSIHNRHIEVRPHDLPWYNSRLRSLKRRVKRKYANAKHQNFNTHAWTSFC